MRTIYFRKGKVAILIFSFSFLLLIFYYPVSAWEVTGLKTPESVIKDPNSPFYYISNINGSPAEKDDNGFISKIGPNGEVIALKFIDGKAGQYTLNAPKGLTINKGILYVADIDSVRAFDLQGGKNLVNINLSPFGARFLNDITCDEVGNLYVSDTATNTIYQIEVAREYKVGVYLQNNALKRPNGLIINPWTKALLVASWQEGKILSIIEGKIEEVPLVRGFKNIDGIDFNGEGNIYFSDYTQGAVYKLTNKGEIEKIIGGLTQPADISVDKENNLLLIPEFTANRVKAIPLRSKTSEEESEFTFPQQKLEEAFDSLGITLLNPPYPMIDFTLKDLKGENLNTKDLRGKFLWINFWATWCSPCRVEMPSMQKIWERFQGENFILLAVNLRESKKRVQSFVQDYGYTFPVLLDTAGEVGRIYGIRGIPTNFFVNPQGEIVGVGIGAREWVNEKFYDFLKKLSRAK